MTAEERDLVLRLVYNVWYCEKFMREPKGDHGFPNDLIPPEINNRLLVLHRISQDLKKWLEGELAPWFEAYHQLRKDSGVCGTGHYCHVCDEEQHNAPPQEAPNG